MHFQCTGVRLLGATLAFIAWPALASAMPVSGEAVPGLAPIDAFFSEYVREREIVGASLAVSYKGRLVYARGFGYADRERGRQAGPETRFRIASLSKPITAVAVLQLVAGGKLRLADPAFDIIDLRPHGGDYGDDRLGQITVEHLLRHEGGWDRDETFDPMFKTYWIGREMGLGGPAGKKDILRYMLSQPLQSAPGSKYIYSNLGYLALGRLIEKSSGGSYEAYVKQSVLGPLGIRGMRVGQGPADKLGADEARYYKDGAPSPKAYKHRIPIHDSVGGWVASAVEMVRFLTAFDADPPARILPEAQRERMLRSRSRGGISLSHRGSLSNCCSSVMHHRDDWSYAAFFNVYKDSSGDKPTKNFDRKMKRAANRVKTWPDHDFFPRYLRVPARRPCCATGADGI